MAELTFEEREELEALKARIAELEPKTVPANNTSSENGTTLPATHWIHKADGTVVTSNGVMSIHGGIPVIGCYEIPAEIQYPDAVESSAHVF